MLGDYYSLPQLLRQQQERVDAERAGPLRQFVTMRLEARPTGALWGHNPLRPGPLDGQPECKHYAVAEYSDGSTQEWGPMAGAK
jgi:hypothetical protein